MGVTCYGLWNVMITNVNNHLSKVLLNELNYFDFFAGSFLRIIQLRREMIS